jgi:phage host-nuclease inhibitor protein Gam
MTKKKLNAASIRVPQNRDEVAKMIAELGEHDRAVEKIEADMNSALAKVKEAATERAKEHKAKAEELLAGVHIYCTANREALTDGGKTKTVDFGTGEVAWRWKPAKVRLSGDEEDIIARIQSKGRQFANFLRTKIEVDKDAMLKHQALAKTIEGVSIGRGGETFSVEPFAQETVAPQSEALAEAAQ